MKSSFWCIIYFSFYLFSATNSANSITYKIAKKFDLGTATLIYKQENVTGAVEQGELQVGNPGPLF